MSRRARWAIVAAGIVFGQILLYGPSLIGEAVLLPVDLLAQPRWYLPQTPETEAIVPHSVVLSDPVLAIEPHRRFAAEELRAGRLPLWNPYNFTGTPMARWAPFSPYNLLYTLLPEPIGLAWIQLLKSLLAGLGAYLFFRRAMDAGFAAAAVGGICYPVTGFFILWQGFPLAEVVAWFPWILLATDRAVRRPSGFGGPGLTAATAAVLWSGKVDVAGQVLLASGVYALWCVIDEYGWPPARKTVRPLVTAAVAWTLGMLLASPYVLPLGEYLSAGGRVSERAGGSEERPPVGLAALPQTVVPDLYGSWRKDSVRITAGNRLASSAATYTGVVAALLLAPLAWCSRRHRSRNLLWVVFVVLGLGWTLNAPGIVHLFRLPFFNLMSHNRFVFVAAFGVLAMAVTGLGWLERGGGNRRWWFWLPPVVLALMTAWLLFLAGNPPEPLATGYARILEAGRQAYQVPDLETLERVRETFAANYRWSAAFCAFAGLGWLLLCVRALPRTRWTGAVFGAVLVGELLSFAYGLAAQSDPDLYFPEIGILEQLGVSTDGRVLGFDCLPPGLNQRFGLREVRGYDGIDPQPIVELAKSLEAPSARAASYAPTMWLKPRDIQLQPEVRLPPVLDLLGVRHVIFRGRPPAGVDAKAADDYWIVDNPRALPRVFIPEQVVVEADPDRRLKLLTAADFDPRRVAYVETEVDLAPLTAPVHQPRITAETPTRITVELDSETPSPALVVLSDPFYPGWKARVDGRPATILRTDHALRGVVVSAGSSELVFSYEPGSLRVGIVLMLIAAAACLFWVLRLRRPATLLLN